MSYKNQSTGEIISNECYNRLPIDKRSKYYYTSDSATHKVENDNDDFLTTAITLGSVLGSLDFSGGNSSDFSSSGSGSSSNGSSFGGFDGGDTGGGGSSGDF